MSDPRSELSSIATALDELTRRLGVIAEQSQTTQEELAYDLFDVERALGGANRRLQKIVGSR